MCKAVGEVYYTVQFTLLGKETQNKKTPHKANKPLCCSTGEAVITETSAYIDLHLQTGNPVHQNSAAPLKVCKLL